MLALMHCAGCGYLPVGHDSAGRCPLCACGAMPIEHIAMASAADLSLTHGVCPRRPRTASGALPALRRGMYRVATQGRYERRPGWGDVLFPVLEEKASRADPEPAPRVPRRLAQSADEIAPSAMRFGMRAAAGGWAVDPWYMVLGDGAEKSMLALRRGTLRAVATWDRPEGAEKWKPAKAIAGRAGGTYALIGVQKLGALLGAPEGKESG